VHSANLVARVANVAPRKLLEAYIRAYVDVALERSALIAVWTGEARHLSSQRRSPMSRRLRSWSVEWVTALRDDRPELSERQAGVLVAGAIGLITSVATTPDRSLHDATLADSITAMALATLDTRFR